MRQKKISLDLGLGRAKRGEIGVGVIYLLNLISGHNFKKAL